MPESIKYPKQLVTDGEKGVYALGLVWGLLVGKKIVNPNIIGLFTDQKTQYKREDFRKHFLELIEAYKKKRMDMYDEYFREIAENLIQNLEIDSDEDVEDRWTTFYALGNVHAELIKKGIDPVDSSISPEYVGAAWISERIGVSIQTVSQAGKRAMKSNYRGKMLKPDAVDEGRPLWKIERAKRYVQSRMEGKNEN